VPKRSRSAIRCRFSSDRTSGQARAADAPRPSSDNRRQTHSVSGQLEPGPRRLKVAHPNGREEYGGFVPDDPDQYRQKRASETWHFCSNCSNWPGWNYHVSYDTPSSGKHSKECEGKRADGTCR